MNRVKNSLNQISYVVKEDAAIRHNGLYSVHCVRIAWQKDNGFKFIPSLWWKDFVTTFLHHTFHFGVIKIIQKLILHQKLDEYPHISFIKKGLSTVQKLHVRCDSLKVILFGINSNYLTKWAESLYIWPYYYFVWPILLWYAS